VQQSRDAGPISSVPATQSLVEWQKRVEIPGCDGLDAAACHEDVHTTLGVAEVSIDSVRLSIENLSSSAEEEDD
jgi:hypothetical protein